MNELNFSEEDHRKKTVLFASGKSTLSHSGWMRQLQQELSSRDLQVHCFDLEEPFTEENLLNQWRRKLSAMKDPSKVIIGGKSQGGRIAVLLADEFKVHSCVCVGYPFYTSLITDDRRVIPLQKIQAHTVIIQGEFDQYGSRSTVENFNLSDAVSIYWKKGGDHHLNDYVPWIAGVIKKFA